MSNDIQLKEAGTWTPNNCPVCGENLKDKPTTNECSIHGDMSIPLTKDELKEHVKEYEKCTEYDDRHRVYPNRGC